MVFSLFNVAHLFDLITSYLKFSAEPCKSLQAIHCSHPLCADGFLHQGFCSHIHVCILLFYEFVLVLTQMQFVVNVSF